MTRLELAGLTTRIVGPVDAPVTVILLHGFGAPGDDLVTLSQAISARARFVFPAAPIELGGLYGDSRAWWHLDLAALERDLASGRVRDRSAEVPDGLAAARAAVTQLISELLAAHPLPPGGKLVVGGFSQGAMLSLDVALHLDRKVDGLVLMSGTLLAASEWSPLMPRLAGVPIVMSHGQRDQLLPFSIAESLRDQLRSAGAILDWQPFAGGHEIPMQVLRAVDALLADRAAC